MFRTKSRSSVSARGKIGGSQTYTSFGELNSTHRPTDSACHFSIISATLIFNCPSSSRIGSSFLSAAGVEEVNPPYRKMAAAAAAEVVDVPEVDVAAAAALSWLTTRSNTDDLLPLLARAYRDKITMKVILPDGRVTYVIFGEIR